MVSENQVVGTRSAKNFIFMFTSWICSFFILRLLPFARLDRAPLDGGGERVKYGESGGLTDTIPGLLVF